MLRCITNAGISTAGTVAQSTWQLLTATAGIVAPAACLFSSACSLTEPCLQVSFSGGASWQDLALPSHYRHAACNRCRAGDAQCRLHLHGPSSWYSGPGEPICTPCCMPARAPPMSSSWGRMPHMCKICGMPAYCSRRTSTQLRQPVFTCPHARLPHHSEDLPMEATSDSKPDDLVRILSHVSQAAGRASTPIAMRPAS